MKIRRLLLLHRAVLRCYPRSFRRQRETAVLRLCARRVGAAARDNTGLVAAWTTTLLDLAWSLIPAWVESGRTGQVEQQTRDRKPRLRRGLLAISLKRSVRGALRNPGFSASVILAIGLSVGATGGVLAIVHRAFFTPLPYESPEELVLLTETTRGDRISTSYPNYRDWQEGLSSFDGMSMFVREGVTLTGVGQATRLLGLAVSSDLFETLGVTMAAGRGLDPATDVEGGPSEVVLGYDLWQTQLGGDPDVLGRSIAIDGAPFEVVGVAPAGFHFPDGIVLGRSDLYLPIGRQVAGWADRGSHPGIYVVGRLGEGVTFASARDETERLVARLSQLHAENEGEGVHMVPAVDEVLGTLPDALLLMSISAGLVLLIGFGNAAGLFLARMVGGSSDKSIALALGADRRDLATELLVEGLVIGALSATVGLGLAGALVRIFREDLAQYPLLDGIGVGGVAALGIVLTALVGSVLVVAMPWAGSFFRGPIDPVGTRKAISLSPRRRGLQRTLVGAQVALAVALLVGSTVLLRSFRALAGADGGIDASNVVAVRMSLPELEYEGPRTLTFFDEFTERVRGLPGVQSVGGISTLPFSGSGSQSRFKPDGVALEDGIRTDVNVILGDYFSAMGLALREGRTFGPQDGPEAPPVVIVDERLAGRFWPGESPVGKRVSGWGLESATVVGVVGHVKNYGVARESREELYMPHEQRPYLSMYVVVRSDREVGQLVAPIRGAAMELDPDVPVIGASAMKEVVEATVSTPRLAARLGSALSVLAALLAFLGAYALIAHSVAQRTRELGLRMALGAQRGSVTQMVLKQGMGIALAGAGLGLAGALAGSSILEGFVFGVSARDPASFLAAAALVLVLIALASYLPARRAAAIDPIAALRSD